MKLSGAMCGKQNLLRVGFMLCPTRERGKRSSFDRAGLLCPDIAISQSSETRNIYLYSQTRRILPSQSVFGGKPELSLLDPEQR